MDTGKLEKWHKMLAGEADCLFKINDVKLRFSFRPFNKIFDQVSCSSATKIECYSLCVQIESSHKLVTVNLKTKHNKYRTGYYTNEQWDTVKI